MKKSIALKISRQQIAHEEIRQACGCINKIDGGIKYCTTHAGLSDTDHRKLELWDEMMKRFNVLCKKGCNFPYDEMREILTKAAKLEDK